MLEPRDRRPRQRSAGKDEKALTVDGGRGGVGVVFVLALALPTSPRLDVSALDVVGLTSGTPDSTIALEMPAAALHTGDGD